MNENTTAMFMNVRPGTILPDRDDPLHIPAARSLEASVGCSPLVRLRHMTAAISKRVSVYAKTEWTNPGGSVKDRPALYIIREAERTGALNVRGRT